MRSSLPALLSSRILSSSLLYVTSSTFQGVVIYSQSCTRSSQSWKGTETFMNAHQNVWSLWLQNNMTPPNLFHSKVTISGYHLIMALSCGWPCLAALEEPSRWQNCRHSCSPYTQSHQNRWKVAGACPTFGVVSPGEDGGFPSQQLPGWRLSARINLTKRVKSTIIDNEPESSLHTSPVCIAAIHRELPTMLWGFLFHSSPKLEVGEGPAEAV